MTTWVNVPYRVISGVAITIVALRVCRAGNNRIRLGKAAKAGLVKAGVVVHEIGHGVGAQAGAQQCAPTRAY